MLKLRDDYINSTVLGKIVNEKKLWLEERKKKEPLESFRDSLRPSTRSLTAALTAEKTVFIMECKKASPSKGLIRESFKPGEIASVYRHYAGAVSVLAEEKFFQGNLEYLPVVSKKSGLPVICKDFIIDEYQIDLARRYSADAVLLMLSVLTDEAYRVLAARAAELDLDVITETGCREEIERAINLGAKIIGINNRNLKDLTVDLERTRELARLIPEDRIKLCESGIYTNSDVRELSSLVNAFLVGSSLTSQENLDMACRNLVYGQVKICGLTRHQDAVAISRAGASYGGLIFAPGSKRRISRKHAKNIIRGVNLKFVGVFANQNAEEIADTASELHLSAVQLHGTETPEFMTGLRKLLPKYCEIWKAVPVPPEGADPEYIRKISPAADRLLLDTKTDSDFGGTGKSFDISNIDRVISTLNETGNDSPAKSRIIVAGGLNAANVSAVAATGVYCVDLNSGVESAPGIKDEDKIKKAFRALRNYF